MSFSRKAQKHIYQTLTYSTIPLGSETSEYKVIYHQNWRKWKPELYLISNHDLDVAYEQICEEKKAWHTAYSIYSHTHMFFPEGPHSGLQSFSSLRKEDPPNCILHDIGGAFLWVVDQATPWGKREAFGSHRPVNKLRVRTGPRQLVSHIYNTEGFLLRYSLLPTPLTEHLRSHVELVGAEPPCRTTSWQEAEWNWGKVPTLSLGKIGVSELTSQSSQSVTIRGHPSP